MAIAPGDGITAAQAKAATIAASKAAAKRTAKKAAPVKLTTPKVKKIPKGVAPLEKDPYRNSIIEDTDRILAEIEEANRLAEEARRKAELITRAGGAYVSSGGTPTGKTDLLLATMQELNIPASIQQASVSFINTLMQDGISESAATQIYYNNKSYTSKDGITVESPFYKEFTYLRDYAPKDGSQLPSPKELMAFKLGVKDLVTKSGQSSLFASEENIQKYISNSVKITDLDTRFAEYSVAATFADPLKVKTLVQMGYIKDSQGLIDFYADSTIGQKQFEINKNTAAFAQQALKRADAGITFDAENLKKLAAGFGVSNMDTTTVEKLSAGAYQSIATNLKPGAKLDSIYNKGNLTDIQRQALIQKELEAEQFMGTESKRRKMLTDLESNSFQGTSGNLMSSNRSSAAGII
jgi:hypothetical protein